ncbi:hypothetical protein ACOMHN_018675 [Nucella lapillus]
MLRLEVLASLVLLYCACVQPQHRAVFRSEHVGDGKRGSKSPSEVSSSLHNPSGTPRRMTWVDFLLQDLYGKDTNSDHNDHSFSMHSPAISSEHRTGLSDKQDTHQSSLTSPYLSSQRYSLQSRSIKQRAPFFEDKSVNKQSSESKAQETVPATNTVVIDNEGSEVLAATESPLITRDTTPASVRDDSTTSLSSLLRDAFLGQNPGMPSRYVESDFSGTQAALSWAHARFLPGRRSQDPSPLRLTDNEPHNSDSGMNDRMRKRQNPSQEENDEAPISVEQRSWRCPLPDVLVGEEDLPWTCRQHFAWRHLGEHVYPSRLYEAVCEGRTCWYGHFNCTPITYTLHVLQVCLRGCQDQRVPSPLRSRWQWRDLNVTVGCQCVR